MSSELPPSWELATVESLCERVTSGGTPARSRAAEFYTRNGHPWVKTKELRDGVLLKTEEHITDAALGNSAAKLLPAQTILVAMYGATVGQLGVLGVDAACNQACCALVADRSVADHRFLFYALLHHRTKLINLASGAAQQNINAGLVRAFEIPRPPLHEQRRIASVLSALDDKIDSNQRRCAIQADVIDAMFSHYVLPRDEPGGTDGDLTSIARFVNGGAFTKGASGKGRPVLRIKELNSGISDATVFNDLDVKDENIARHHDLLFSWSGSLDVYRWHGPEALINQHIFKVLPLDGFPVWFVEGWIRHHLPEFQGIAQDKATTMGHIKREHLTQARATIPPHEVIAGLDEALSPLDEQIGALARETTTLRALRAELLPKLVSGEMRVASDADDDDEQRDVAA